MILKKLYLLLLLAHTCASIMGQTIPANGSFTLYKPNTKEVAVTGSYKNSLPEGEWRFYSHGYLQEIHRYRDGLLQDSFFTRFDTYAKPSIYGMFKNNLREGKWVEHNRYSSGGMEILNYTGDQLQGWKTSWRDSILFEQGKANGPYAFFDRYSPIHIRGNYSMNRREGSWTVINSAQQYTDRYEFRNNKLNGIYTRHSADSALLEKCSFVNDLAGDVNFIYRFKDSSDHTKGTYLFETRTYKNGMLDGPQVKYNPGGDTVSVLEWKADLRHGISLYWFENGAPSHEEDYREGVQTWWSRRWYPNGQTKEIRWQDGEYDSSLAWTESGVLISATLKKPRLSRDHEYSKKWDAQGKLTMLDTLYWKNGNSYFDSFRYENGILLGESHLINFMRSGRWYVKDKYEVIYENDSVKKVLSGKDPEFVTDLATLAVYDTVPHPVRAEGRRHLQDIFFTQRINETTQGYSPFKKLCSNYDPIYYFGQLRPESKRIKELDIKGEVVIRIYVFQWGLPACASIIKSLHPEADAEALRVVLNCSYHPARKDGVPVSEWAEITVRF